MVTDGAEIKAPESGGANNETTTWSVYTSATPARNGFNVTVDPTTIIYDATTTEASFVSYTMGKF